MVWMPVAGTPIARMEWLWVWAVLGAVCAAYGVRLIAYSKQIARRRAIKHSAVPKWFYTLNRVFSNTEDNLPLVRFRTILSGVTFLCFAAMFVELFIKTLKTP